MAEFNIEKKIQSCHITKEIISQLEDYITNRVPEIADLDRGDIRRSLSISIEDKIGTQTMSSISEYGFPHFGAELTHGDHRFNKKTVRESDSWEGFGRSWNLEAGYSLMGEGKVIVFFSYGEENYDAEFFGEDADMRMKMFTFGLRGRW